MQELLSLQQFCLENIGHFETCGNNCPIGHYCTHTGCEEGDCMNCLYQIQHCNPMFHYSCTHITYYYVMRFFNRFASEITHLFNNINVADRQEINVVSLGCGPGSEIYGLIKSLRMRNIDVKINYEGHDLVRYWEPVQNKSIECLSNLRHSINFYTSDLFADFHGFPNGQVDFLILNYLLSDAAFFMANQQKHVFVSDIADFIVHENVKMVLFNDIRLYGESARLNSGTMLIKLLIEKLNERGKRLQGSLRYFVGDPYLGKNARKWIQNTSNALQLQVHPDNNYMRNVDYCKSKQAIINIL